MYDLLVLRFVQLLFRLYVAISEPVADIRLSLSNTPYEDVVMPLLGIHFL